MKSSEIEKEVERIIRYHKYPHYGRTFYGLMSVIRELRRFIEANFEPKAKEEPTAPSKGQGGDKVV